MVGVVANICKVELVTSASTDLNVVTPGKTENEDPKEHPIPHQFVSVFQGLLINAISQIN